MSMKILFINACVRENSRTRTLADHLLGQLSGEITELNLDEEPLAPLGKDRLDEREQLLREGKLQNPMFRYAHQFADADLIVCAAPYWDLGFPSLMKIYLEAITVSDITFRYVDGIPQGLCKAGRLIYLTTSGGPVFADFGYSYVKTLAQSFYGIRETVCFKAENLDVYGMDVHALLEKAKKEISEYLTAEK